MPPCVTSGRRTDGQTNAHQLDPARELAETVQKGRKLASQRSDEWREGKVTAIGGCQKPDWGKKTRETLCGEYATGAHAPVEQKLRATVGRVAQACRGTVDCWGGARRGHLQARRRFRGSTVFPARSSRNKVADWTTRTLNKEVQNLRRADNSDRNIPIGPEDCLEPLSCHLESSGVFTNLEREKSGSSAR